MNTTVKKLGTFSVYSGQIVIKDPSYTSDAWCQSKLEVSLGKWDANLIQKNGVTQELKVLNTKYDAPEARDWELSQDEIGIDSGALCVCDNFSKVDIDTEEVGKVFERGMICKPGVNNDNFNLYVVRSNTGVVIGIKIKFVY